MDDTFARFNKMRADYTAQIVLKNAEIKAIKTEMTHWKANAADADLTVSKVSDVFDKMKAERDALKASLENIEGHGCPWRERAEKAEAELLADDQRITATRVALTAAGLPEVEPYPEEPGLSEYDRSLRAGGRVIPDDERVRRLAAERDALREKYAEHVQWDVGNALDELQIRTAERDSIQRQLEHDCNALNCLIDDERALRQTAEAERDAMAAQVAALVAWVSHVGAPVTSDQSYAAAARYLAADRFCVALEPWWGWVGGDRSRLAPLWDGWREAVR